MLSSSNNYQSGFSTSSTIEAEIAAKMSGGASMDCYEGFNTKPQYRPREQAADPFHSQSMLDSTQDEKRQEHLDQLMPDGWQDSREKRLQDIEHDPRNDSSILAPTREDMEIAFEQSGLSLRSQISSRESGSSRYGMQSLVHPIFGGGEDTNNQQLSEAQARADAAVRQSQSFGKDTFQAERKTVDFSSSYAPLQMGM